MAVYSSSVMSVRKTFAPVNFDNSIDFLIKPRFRLRKHICKRVKRMSRAYLARVVLSDVAYVNFSASHARINIDAEV